MRALLVAAICAFATACGGGTNGGGLNPAFGKHWVGTSTVSGAVSLSYAAQLTIAVDGDEATVTQICPDNSGSLTVTGSGNSAAWTGNLVCPAIAGQGCSLNVTYTSASATLSSDGRTLTATATANVSGCASGSATNVFQGT
jgi:hypothetical protein